MSKFLQMVQDHERLWGTDSYVNRPSLAGMLSAQVVVFWQPVTAKSSKDPRESLRLIVTTHDTLEVLEKHLTRALLLNATPQDRKFVTAFHNQREIKLKSVKIQFGYVDETNPNQK